MKCVLDTTVNLKQLLAHDGSKLMTIVNGKSLLEHHFSAMQGAGVTSLFVLIESESQDKGVIAREALKFGYNATFLEVEKEIIHQRRSLMVAEPYLKETFLYWPVNRMVSEKVAAGLVKFPINSHQVLSLVYTERKHPQIDKSVLYKTEFQDTKKINKSGENSKVGYDVGVYKCAPIVFRLIEKIAGDKTFSWNRLQTALGRAGRSVVYPMNRTDWGIIENNHDLSVLEKHQASFLVEKLSISSIDRNIATGWYAKLLPSMVTNGLLKRLGLNLFTITLVICLALMLTGQFIVSLVSVVLASVMVFLFPVLKWLHDNEIGDSSLDKKGNSLFRLFLLAGFSITSYLAFGFGFWALASLLLIASEIFFMVRPVEIPDEKLESIVSSYTIHAIVGVISALVILPTMSLLVAGVFSFLISSYKGQLFYKAYQRDKV